LRTASPRSMAWHSATRAQVGVPGTGALVGPETFGIVIAIECLMPQSMGLPQASMGKWDRAPWQIVLRAGL
jgi:hypothetical protein